MRTLGTVSLRKIGGDRAGELQAGRFFANPKVTPQAIIDSWSEHTTDAVAERHVLAIQDTSDITFTTRADRRRDLGQLNATTHGLLAHVMLTVDADTGACLGLAGGTIWNRPELVKTHHNKRRLEDKESRRWIETAEAARPVLAKAAMVTVLADRESDLYSSWALVPRPNYHLLTRAMVDRELALAEDAPAGTPDTLFAAASGFAVAGTRTIKLPARPPTRAKREACLELRFGAVEIVRPRLELNRDLKKTVKLYLVEAREPDPPEGVEALHWRLLTTHPVTGVAMAWRIVDWYRHRWVVEQLFRTMKARGLKLEESQLATAERLMKLTAAAVKAACLIMQLVQEREGLHRLEATVGFSEAEIDTIERLVPTLEGRTERQKNPHPPRGLARASWVIARLGGWTGYYGKAGPITMADGLERFHAIHMGRMLVSNSERDVRIR
jgi:hypothetical protein